MSAAPKKERKPDKKHRRGSTSEPASSAAADSGGAKAPASRSLVPSPDADSHSPAASSAAAQHAPTLDTFEDTASPSGPSATATATASVSVPVAGSTSVPLPAVAPTTATSGASRPTSSNPRPSPPTPTPATDQHRLGEAARAFLARATGGSRSRTRRDEHGNRTASGVSSSSSSSRRATVSTAGVSPHASSQHAVSSPTSPTSSKVAPPAGPSDQRQRASSIQAATIQRSGSSCSLGDRYVFDEQSDESLLGSGKYGVVRRGADSGSGIDVAIKVINKSKSSHVDRLCVDARREIEVQRTLSSQLKPHPAIVQCLMDLEDEENHYVVMEMVGDGTTLGDYLVERTSGHELCLPEADAHAFFTQVASAVEYCHKAGVAHRDLSLDNVLIVPRDRQLPSLKLADFGFAAMYKPGELATTYPGTFGYASPQILTGTPHDPFKSDVWSLGVVLYLLLTTSYPFGARDNPANRTRILAGTPKYDRADAPLSSLAVDLLRRMFAVDPVKRFNIEDVLLHPWTRWRAPSSGIAFGSELF